MSCFQQRYLEPGKSIRITHAVGLREKQSAYVFLHPGELHNAFINGSLADEAIHCNLACLSQAMSSVHCLCIVGGVPIVVVENNGVGGRQVDAQTSCSSAQNED